TVAAREREREGVGDRELVLARDRVEAQSVAGGVRVDGVLQLAVGGGDRGCREHDCRRQHGGCHSAHFHAGSYGVTARPPVTSMVVPVVYEASSDSSQRIARATSSAVPARGIGRLEAMRAARSGSPPEAWISVSMMPGRTALTRMPSPASSSASPTV